MISYYLLLFVIRKKIKIKTKILFIFYLIKFNEN